MSNFSSKKHPIVLDKTPKFAIGDKVVINSPRHSASGQSGEITEVWSNQAQVRYMVKLGKWKQMIPESMIRKVKK